MVGMSNGGLLFHEFGPENSSGPPAIAVGCPWARWLCCIESREPPGGGIGVGMVRPPNGIAPGPIARAAGLLILRPSLVICSLAHLMPNLQLPLSTVSKSRCKLKRRGGSQKAVARFWPNTERITRNSPFESICRRRHPRSEQTGKPCQLDTFPGGRTCTGRGRCLRHKVSSQTRRNLSKIGFLTLAVWRTARPVKATQAVARVGSTRLRQGHGRVAVHWQLAARSSAKV